MALAAAYTEAPVRQVYDVIIITHFDSHGVATAASVYKKFSEEGKNVKVFSRFPATGPTPQFPQFINELQSQVEAQEAYIVDIPVNVRSPDLHIEAESRIPASTIYHVDHHETSVPFAPRLAARGVIPLMFNNAVQMAAGLGVIDDDLARVGIVADRDPAIVSVVERSEIESLLDKANKLDVIVRTPNIIGCQDQGCVAEKLATGAVNLDTINVEYPPAREVNNVNVIAEGEITILADFERVNSMWTPKTAEEILRRRQKDYIVFVAPAMNPRTRQREGWDVRVLQYWLSTASPEPEAIVRDIVTQYAISGNVVGHARYVSVRLVGAEKERAIQLARTIYQRIEGRLPSTARLISDEIVARMVRQDYAKLYELLERIAVALERGASAKERQVQLIEEDIGRRRYD